MSGFKFRNDYEEENNYGQKICWTKWMGGPSMAGIKNCNSEIEELRGRTAFITDWPGRPTSSNNICSWFSPLAKVNYKGKSVKGFITVDKGEFYFTPDKF